MVGREPQGININQVLADVSEAEKRFLADRAHVRVERIMQMQRDGQLEPSMAEGLMHQTTRADVINEDKHSIRQGISSVHSEENPNYRLIMLQLRLKPGQY